MARETWKPVVGYEGLYEVSDQGRVRSLRRSGTTGRVLTQWQNRGRVYLLVRLSRNNQRKIKTVHSLVLAAFVGPRPARMEIRHLNGDATDNRLANLAYGTSLENSTDQRAHGTNVNANKLKCPRGHDYTAENTIWRAGRRACRTCNNAQQNARRKEDRNSITGEAGS